MNLRYEAKEPLATGGRGEVLRGWDSHLGREVAIKRVRREAVGWSEEASLSMGAGTGATLDELVREARTLSTVQHPNVVTVYDAGVDEDGAFIVMELVKGETLEDIVSRGALTEKDFGLLVEQTLDGLMAAHQGGVIHLDLKPQNLMLTWLPGGGFQVKILDFGLAITARQPVIQDMDAEGAIFGSIYFMAPEQFERGQVDARTDLYALGCIFYYALTQRYPFGGELGVQVMTSHLHHKRVALERLRPDLPAFVPAWVEWLISRQQGDRPESTAVALTAFREKKLPEKKGAAAAETPVVAVTTAEESQSVGKLRRDLIAQSVATDPGRIQVKAKAGALERAKGGVGPARASLPGPATAAVSRWSRYTIPVLALLTVIAGVWFYLKKRQGEVRLQRFAELVQGEVASADGRDARLLLDFATDPDTSPAACLALIQMGGGAEVNGAILNEAKAAKEQIPKVNLLKVLAVREINGGVELGLVRLGDADREVAKAAWGVVAVMGKPDMLPQLLERCETLPQELEPFAEAALVGIIQRAENPDEAAGSVINAYQGALGTGRYRAILVRVLGQSGAKGAFAQLTRAIQSGTVEVRRAAVSALALWPSNEPLDLLAGRFEVEEDAAARLMILRAAVPLVMQPGVMSEEALLTQVRRMTAAAKDRREKDQAAAVAARVEAPATLELLAELATKEPERAASLEGMRKRLSETLEKVCVPEEGSIALPVEKAVFAPGSGELEVKKGVLSGWSGAGDAVGWLVEVKEPGMYRVQVSQAQQEGAAVIYDVLFAGERLATKSVLTGRNQEAFKAFEIGSVKVEQPGHHRLILKVRQMPPGAGAFQLKALSLKKE